MDIQVKIWDKESPINGDPAESFLQRFEIYKNKTVILLLVDGMVVFHEGYDPDKTEAIEEGKLMMVKREVINQLLMFDSSTEVNSFYINKNSFWIDSETRTKYRTAIESAELLGETNIEIPLAELIFTLDISQAKIMLAKIERYAYKSAIVTLRHRDQISVLSTIEDVLNYDYKQGYPEKESFEIPNL